MSAGITRVSKSFVIAAMLIAVIAAVAIPAAWRAIRTRRTAELGSAARERLAAGDTEEAVRLYALYLRQAPDDAEAHAAYATLMRKRAELPGSGRRHREAALSAINDAVRADAGSLSLRRMLAVTLLELGQFGTARDELVVLRDQAKAATPERLTAAGVDLDEITLLEARTAFANDRMSDAASLAAGLTGFDAAGSRFDPAWKPGRFVTEATILLATILAEKRHDPQAAERVLTTLTETVPDDSRGWLTLARWYASHGEPRRAAEASARAAAISPDSHDVLAMGFALAMAGNRFEEAERQARRICELFPDLPDGALFLADVAVRRGEPAQALEPLERAIERFPDHPAILLALAHARLLANRLDEAEQTIGVLMERSERTNPAVGMLEARLLVARGRWLAAVKKLDMLRPLMAESGDAKRQVDLLLSECHARLGRADEQLAASRRALDGDSSSLPSRVASAAALAANGQPEKALAAYESVARDLGAERLVREQQVWRPLLRLRGAHQLRLPADGRDWSEVVELLDLLERTQAVPESELAVLRYDHLLAAGDATAENFLRQAVGAHGHEPQLWERLVAATARQEGLAAALRRIESLPGAVVDAPSLLLLRARLAAGASDDEAETILSAVEAKAASLPAEQSSRLLAAVAAVRAGRGDQVGAERVRQAILAVSPDDLPTYFAMFEQACERRDPANAGVAADEICRLCGADTATGRAVKAARLMVEVTAGRSHAATSRDGEPMRTESPDPQDAARLDAARTLLVEAENERPGWPLLQRLGADLELMRGDVPAAIARLEKAVTLSPENLRFIQPLVTLLAGSNRQARARELLHQIIDSGGDAIVAENVRVWARRALAELATRTGSYRDAEEAVDRLAQNRDRDGKPAVADMVLGIGLLAGRPEPAAWRRAILGFEAVARRRPLTSSERLQLAELCDRVGGWEQYRADVLDVASQSDLPSVPLAAAADMLIRHGDVEQAESCLKTLAAREPKAVRVIVLETRLALARDDRPAAVEAARRLASSEPDPAEGPQRLSAAAALLEECGENDEAEVLLTRLADQSAAGVLAQADFLARHGRTVEALDLLQANRRRLGPASYLRAAVSVLRMADDDVAAVQAERVDNWFMAAAGDTDAASILRAEFSAARGRHDEAASVYRRQLEREDLSPSDRAILQNNLAMQLVRPETADEAGRLIAEAIATQGPHPSLLDTQGLALLAGGAPRAAVDVLREASLDRSTEKCLHLACALVATGELDEARRVLVAAVSGGLDRRRLDVADRKRLAEVEKALD